MILKRRAVVMIQNKSFRSDRGPLHLLAGAAGHKNQQHVVPAQAGWNLDAPAGWLAYLPAPDEGADELLAVLNRRKRYSARPIRNVNVLESQASGGLRH